MNRKSFILLLNEWTKNLLSHPAILSYKNPTEDPYKSDKHISAKSNSHKDAPITTSMPNKEHLQELEVHLSDTKINRHKEQEVMAMDNPQRMIIVGYCIAIMCAVLYVPWIVQRYNDNGVLVNIAFGYSFIFSSPVPNIAMINYGVVLLEIAATTAIAAIAYIFRNELFRLIKR